VGVLDRWWDRLHACGENQRVMMSGYVRYGADER
jgi:hypothetical protein